jgi:acyl carrier protein
MSRPEFHAAEIEQMIVEYIRSVRPLAGVDLAAVLDSKLRRILDSMDVLELASYLEQTFNLEISDEDLVGRNFDTVRSIVEFVSRRLGTPTEAPTQIY